MGHMAILDPDMPEVVAAREARQAKYLEYVRATRLGQTPSESDNDLVPVNDYETGQWYLRSLSQFASGEGGGGNGGGGGGGIVTRFTGPLVSDGFWESFEGSDFIHEVTEEDFNTAVQIYHTGTPGVTYYLQLPPVADFPLDGVIYVRGTDSPADFALFMMTQSGEETAFLGASNLLNSDYSGWEMSVRCTNAPGVGKLYISQLNAARYIGD